MFLQWQPMFGLVGRREGGSKSWPCLALSVILQWGKPTRLNIRIWFLLRFRRNDKNLGNLLEASHIPCHFTVRSSSEIKEKSVALFWSTVGLQVREDLRATVQISQPDLRGETEGNISVAAGLVLSSLREGREGRERVWRLVAGHGWDCRRTAVLLQTAAATTNQPQSGLEVSDLYHLLLLSFLSFLLQTQSLPLPFFPLSLSIKIQSCCQVGPLLAGCCCRCELSSITNHVHIIFLICSVFFTSSLSRNEERHHPR